MFALILSVIVSLEADFVQTKTVAMMSEPQVSTGHMVYRAPEYMLWAYTAPQTIIWEIDGNKSNVNPQIQKLLKMIMSSIAGNNADDPNTGSPQLTGSGVSKLQRESKRMFRSVNVIMDEQNNVARRVELIEKNGDTTVIEFSNVVTQ